jgi:hypothetical protein
MTTDNFCFYFQSRLIQTSQPRGQQYSNTSPLVFPGLTLVDLNYRELFVRLMRPKHLVHEDNGAENTLAYGASATVKILCRIVRFCCS